MISSIITAMLCFIIMTALLPWNANSGLHHANGTAKDIAVSSLAGVSTRFQPPLPRCAFLLIGPPLDPTIRSLSVEMGKHIEADISLLYYPPSPHPHSMAMTMSMKSFPTSQPPSRFKAFMAFVYFFIGVVMPYHLLSCQLWDVMKFIPGRRIPRITSSKAG